MIKTEEPVRMIKLRRNNLWGIELIILIIFVIFGGILFLIDTRLRPTILAMAEAKARIIATDAINTAINDKIAMSIKYEDLMNLKQDSRGRVVAVQPNTGEINRLASQTAIQVQSMLRSISEDKISIPIGQAFGSQLLAGYGPSITVRIRPLGTVQPNVIDRFEQAGINQSRHRIYLEVTARIQIVVPLVSKVVTVTSEVPITETIIMGEVPQVYFGLGSGQQNSLIQPSE